MLLKSVGVAVCFGIHGNSANLLFKVTEKARGLGYNKSSPGKTTESLDIKIEDE